MSVDNDDCLGAIEDCEYHEGALSDWERNFLDSIRNYIQDGRSLSEKQINKLNAIWERVAG